MTPAGRVLLFIVPLATACSPPPSPPVYADAVPPARIDAAVDADDGASTVSPNMTPYPAPEFTAILPLGGPEQDETFTVTASARLVDVHILIDSTASFTAEIATLQHTLTAQIFPALRARIPSLTIGVSSFEDMPIPPFGLTTDRVFVLYAPQTSDLDIVNNAVFQIYQGNGGDDPEDWAEGLYQVATGAGFVLNGRELIQPFVPRDDPNEGTLGGVGFRSGSTRALVLITDAPTHDASDYADVVPNAHSLSQAVSALQALNVHVVGIAASDEARPDEEAVAIATGATTTPTAAACATGVGGTAVPADMGLCPLVFDITPDGTGLSTSLVTSIGELLDTAVYSQVYGTATDDTNGFVRAIEAESSNPPGAVMTDQFPTGAPDGIDDTFTNVHANTQLTFRLHLQNLSVPATEFPQTFWIHVQVLGDGIQLQDTLVRVIVPEGPKFDAGFVD